MRPKPKVKLLVVVTSLGGKKEPAAGRNTVPRASAQWKGGGKIHTPHMRSYVVAMPKKMRRGPALRSALSSKAAENQIVVGPAMNFKLAAEPKTRLMAGALNKLVGDASALVLIPSAEILLKA